MEAGRCKCLWFQSSFVIWRQQQGGNWQELPTRAIHLPQSKVPMDVTWRGRARELFGPLRKLSQLVILSFPPHPRHQSHPPLVAFHRLATPTRVLPTVSRLVFIRAISSEIIAPPQAISPLSLFLSWILSQQCNRNAACNSTSYRRTPRENRSKKSRPPKSRK